MKLLMISAKDFRNRKVRNNYWEISDELAEVIATEYRKTRRKTGMCPITSDGDNRIDIEVAIVDEKYETVFGWKQM